MPCHAQPFPRGSSPPTHPSSPFPTTPTPGSKPRNLSTATRPSSALKARSDPASPPPSPQLSSSRNLSRRCDCPILSPGTFLRVSIDIARRFVTFCACIEDWTGPVRVWRRAVISLGETPGRCRAWRCARGGCANAPSEPGGAWGSVCAGVAQRIGGARGASERQATRVFVAPGGERYRRYREGEHLSSEINYDDR